MADEKSCLDQVKTDLHRMKEFLVSKLLIINAHNVDFFTKNLWEKCLPKEIRDDLDKLTEQEIATLPLNCIRWIERPDDLVVGSLSRCSGLLRLFNDIRNHHLKTLSYVKKSEYFDGLVEDSVLTSFMMSPKKSYEVGVMSQAVHDLVQKTKATKVIDLGSGKGYLSQYLSLRHHINVVGVDSSDSNTKNAEKRNAKTLKVWHFLLKKVNSKTGDNERGLTELTRHNVGSNDDVQADSSILSESNCLSASCSCGETIGDHVFEKEQGMMNEDNVRTQKDPIPKSDLQTRDINCTDLANSNSASTTNDAHMTHVCDMPNNILNDTVLFDINDKESSSASSKNAGTIDAYNAKSSELTSYQAITGFVSHDIKIVQQLGSLTDKESRERLVLVGLHTCGDLAPTAIKIFLNDCHVKALCLVGCCYHLLSQPTLTESSPQDNEDSEYGFPVSEYLKKESFSLSRNATMVAQQAADRLASAGKIPPKSILYRSILQVILKEKFGLDTTGMHVGRIGAKCKSFQEYIEKSFKKLGLPSDQITVEEIESFYQRFEEHEYQIMAFHQLRACIAPCIESLFLIDRLCYLLEQGVNNARIVALFDPVKSPRSYAIIASK